MSEPKVPCLRVLKAGSGQVHSVGWSPDGTRLAIGYSSGAVEVFTTEGRSLWKVEAHDNHVYDVAWSPDGRQLASSSYAVPGVRIWDVETGRPLLSLREGAGWAVAWSPSGERLAWTPDANLVVSDAVTGGNMVTNSESIGLIFSVDWSPEGRQIVSGGREGAVGIWDAESGQLVAKLKGNGTDVDSVEWSPDGSRVACDGIGVRIWDRALHHCLVHCGNEKVRGVSWSSSGGLIAAGVKDGTVAIWDAEIGRELARLRGHSESVWAVAFSQDGARLASAGDGVRIWDVRELVVRQRGTADVDAELFRYATRQAATVGRRTVQKTRYLWVPELSETTRGCLGALRGSGARSNGGHAPGVDVFPDGQTLASGHPDGLLQRWDLKTGKPIWIGRERHTRMVKDVKVSPQGTLIASASNDRTIRIWKAEDGACIKVLSTDSDCVQVCWSPDGGRIAAALGDNYAIRVWDASTGESVLSLRHGSTLWGVAWSPDGQLLASGSRDRTVHIWRIGDVQNLRPSYSLFEAHSRIVRDVEWSPDGTSLASCSKDGTVAIWDTQSWALRLRYRGHLKTGNSLECLAWSPDGRLLASAGWGKVVHVWEAGSGRDVAEFPSEKGYVGRLAWSPDGSFLATSHAGDVIRFWDTRQLMKASAVELQLPTAGVLSSELSILPAALAGLHRLGLYPPLSLLKDLLDLTGGDKGRDGLAILTHHPGVRALAALHWPAAARVGLVALLLREVPLEAWSPPADAASAEVAETLARALRGEAVEPEAPPPPVAALQQGVEVIDDRLLTLLSAIGPEAVAADPGLPLRLLVRLPSMTALSATCRRMLGIRLGSGSAGRSLGYGSGSERSGVELRGDLRSLLPSQLALPEEVLTSRHLRGELLYRARTGEEAPRLRPTLLVLDISPASFGPAETTTRLAAHVLASSLLQASLPVVLVTAGGRSGVYPLERVSDLVEVWTQRSLEPAEVGRALGVARALRETLRGEPLEPVIVVLAHAYFGAEEEVPVVAGLRGLFVQYPSLQVRPALASVCERWESVAAGETADLAERLARVVG